MNIPKHVAIIMDGNRRWARARGLPDFKGHKAGAAALEKIVEAASKLGIKTLTVYALSTENLEERAKREIFALFNLIETGFRQKISKMTLNGVKVEIIGEVDGLPGQIRKIIEDTRKTYIKNETIKLNIALNYGGKRELLTAIKRLIEDGINIDQINDKMVRDRLYTSDETDPEMVIRTGGQVRLSNFLLWQTGYSELYFTKTLWPDFGEKELKTAVLWYQRQKRNFGK